MTTRVETPYRYIEIDEQGHPIIAGTRFKVYVLIEYWQTNAWTPEELHEQFPILSMAQIHSALAYYWDHKEEVDQTIEETGQMIDELRRSTPEPPALEKFRRLRQQQES